MPKYMDIHRNMQGKTTEQVASAHKKDLQVQDKYGVQFLKYWFDEDAGTVFCLSEAPSRDAAIAVHREANGSEPDESFEVQEGS